MTRSREENRIYQRERRARQAADRPTRAVPDGVPSVVGGVLAELAALPHPQGQGRPGLVAVAVRMAELLDDPQCQPQHPAAAARLRDLLAELRTAPTRPQHGALAQLRARRVTRLDPDAYSDDGSPQADPTEAVQAI